jgi:phospholipid-binding lipoprotein MlaA
VLKAMKKSAGVSRVLAVALAAMLLASCASAPNDGANDPLESFNREMFDINIALDKTILRPVTQAYVDFVPDPVRDMVHNFLFHLGEPVTFANDLLQGEFDRAGQTAARMVTNTIIGFGMWDVMASSGAAGHKEDLGQTFAVWGAPEGPYLVLPLLGPSTARDTAGDAVQFALAYNDLDVVGHLLDTYTDSTAQFLISSSRTLVNAVDKRAQVLGKLAELEKTSLDFYATIRSLYRQKRADEIRNGESGEAVPIPDITLELDEPTAREPIAQTSQAK